MYAEGLEGIVVARTELARVDGEGGRLVVRGRDVEALAGRWPFESMCGLLWTGEEPSPAAHSRLQEALYEGRRRAWEQLPRLGDALARPDGMDALRGALGQLPLDQGEPADLQRAAIGGAVAVHAAAWGRRRAQPGSEVPAPRPDASLAEDYLRMLGLPTEPARVAALDTYLTTVAEHGMCASTFTARVVASTDSDRLSAIVAAIGALKGPLHGGAPGPVLDMLDAISSESFAEPWLRARLEAGERIMGMGHRVYRVRDPRAAVLERAVEALAGSGVVGERRGRLELARAVEATATRLLRERHPERPMAANVEWYTAVLLEAIGLDRSLFSPTFATGRTAGWLAHVDEQQRSGRIIRPRCEYVGPLPEPPEEPIHWS